MPTVHCLFARPSSGLHRVLLTEPDLAEHVYLLTQCPGLEPRR
ncbi:MAG: hypothetical protein QM765_30140 [Myxococcales bacterium]